MATFYTQPIQNNASFTAKDFLLHCFKNFNGINAIQEHISACRKAIENENNLFNKDDSYWIQERIKVLENGKTWRTENIKFTERYHQIWHSVKNWEPKENFSIKLKQFALEQLTLSNFNFSYLNDLLQPPLSEVEWIVRAKQRCLNNIEEHHKKIRELEILLNQQLAKLEELNKDLVYI